MRTRHPVIARSVVAWAGILLLGACQIRMDLGTNVNEDGSGTLTFSYAFDQEFMDFAAQSGDDPLADLEAPEDLPPNVTAERFEEGGFTGVRLTSAFANLDELATIVNDITPEDQQDLFTSYSVRQEGDAAFVFEATIPDDPFGVGAGEPGGASPGVVGPPPEMLANLFDVTVRVTLPGAIADSNADRIEGGTAIWEIDPASGGGKTLTARSGPRTGGDGGLWIPLAIGIAVLLLIAIVVVVMVRRRGTPAVAAAGPWDGPPLGGPEPPPPPPPPPPSYPPPPPAP